MPDIVLGEDHTAVADALATVLADDEGCVVAVAGTVAGVRQVVVDRQPDLLLLDRWFPDGDGFALLTELAEAAPDTRILVITADADPGLAHVALALGAHGFVHTTRGASALLGAIGRALAGEKVVELPPRWTSVPQPRGRPAPTIHLTTREQQCLTLLVQDVGTAQMAEALAVSVTTVRTHVQAVMTKLGVHTRREAVAYAARHGLVPDTGAAHDPLDPTTERYA
ncbi:DNA-binding response regulator [Actinomycetospora sp. NBRC 106375]|uniref:response regulator transcription factor n=1 Tax=Actinomycetospora sp. NBRC 106375 TaxID=3032207 RepID=UPI0024A22F2D|nr:response regulator transcription factor [Actinomycetospora sp. NBRC 106375]GLZ48441.1 DNA-binding response regulator [Actinomycetospora sp. NBRC 106375]